MTREEGAKAYQAKVVANNPQAEAYDFESAYNNGWKDGVEEMQTVLSSKFHEIWTGYSLIQQENIQRRCKSDVLEDKMREMAYVIRLIENYGL